MKSTKQKVLGQTHCVPRLPNDQNRLSRQSCIWPSQMAKFLHEDWPMWLVTWTGAMEWKQWNKEKENRCLVFLRYFMLQPNSEIEKYQLPVAKLKGLAAQVTHFRLFGDLSRCESPHQINLSERKTFQNSLVECSVSSPICSIWGFESTCPPSNQRCCPLCRPVRAQMQRWKFSNQKPSQTEPISTRCQPCPF